jgi:serine/threonine protein kinase
MEKRETSPDLKEKQPQDTPSTAGYTLGSARIPLASDSEPEIQPGTIIDDFIVLNHIGPGGCGVVYKAQQRSISREVALKLIRPDLATPGFIARFEIEKDTLGSLNHPNIVNIIAGGKTSPELGGRPFFAMEYVEGGLPITIYADKHDFTIDKRLKLFLQICDAIEYAHEREVVHRDLKPANILVTEKSNGEPLVKVIDFGIAKAVNNGLPLAYATRTGIAIGTWEYMSPEQTGLSSDSADESSDIYALGVVLYELLVGRPPLDVKGNDQERGKIICKRRPRPPSERINEKDDATYFLVAKKRGVDPSQLEKMLHGELDRIAMKCLQKKPQNRYDLVGSLAADINNYLAGQKAGNLGIVKKKRKTMLFAGAGIIMLLTVLGVVVSQNAKHKEDSPKRVEDSSANAQNVSKPPDYSTPEGLLINMLSVFDSNQKDISELRNHQTKIGKQVWDWLIQRQWFKGKGMGRIIERKPEKDGRQELVLLYDYSDGTEKMSVIFYKEGGVLKFHDIYLFDMKGDHFDMFLSHIIIDRVLSKIEFAYKNPDKVTGGMLDIFNKSLYRVPRRL